MGGEEGNGDEGMKIMNDKNGIEFKALWAVDAKHRKGSLGAEFVA